MSRTHLFSIMVLTAVLVTAFAFALFTPDGRSEPIPVAHVQPNPPGNTDPGACACSPVADEAPSLIDAHRRGFDGVRMVSIQHWTPDTDGLCGGRPGGSKHSVSL